MDLRDWRCSTLPWAGPTPAPLAQAAGHESHHLILPPTAYAHAGFRNPEIRQKGPPTSGTGLNPAFSRDFGIHEQD